MTTRKQITEHHRRYHRDDNSGPVGLPELVYRPVSNEEDDDIDEDYSPMNNEDNEHEMSDSAYESVGISLERSTVHDCTKRRYSTRV